MAEDLVMRSVYVRAGEDAQLRQLAHELNVTKSDLIRSAISRKLAEWIADNSGEKLRADIASGLREVSLQREVRRVKPVPIGRKKVAAAKPATSKKAAVKATKKKELAPAE
ncbi:hypothetical protein CAF53_01870 [Sphingobium sp. LB126]|uniref:hypothetical protein n=1 Tax=Sphingobium sp. LB126 TaxID=1983755 RepID=UPI000C206567|nr:hypothetical protein [Sphingobium sp. LB126]PJG47123.1 hypothetical protein CAF53_01870 [Sphingobium sp. LB126]